MEMKGAAEGIITIVEVNHSFQKRMKESASKLKGLFTILIEWFPY
ncbi:hypothetical protein JMA_33230 [Jeotgalibacillus malaysiensis]|uniref:Uncharacterized protein n=1 Tax=Jeotgalibacillus malaysiensis TaxID=1508404 RepID=A0A0B5AQX8_9BACL|nr:hypothetical protein JMA_33230 [Jeotgalibacillus malaysiensis]